MTGGESGSESVWALLGASRGLGASFAKELLKDQKPFRVYSRKSGGIDFTQKEKWSQILEQIFALRPRRVVYFAGGGPHGRYGEKEFKDHQWAFRLNFEFPAFLLHSLLTGSCKSINQICFIGSAIAEHRPDPMAASYSAAKHALRGLITSVQVEEHGALDLRLFSPGYMDTALLPSNAWPRQGGAKVSSPDEVVVQLKSWLENPTFANQNQVFE